MLNLLIGFMIIPTILGILIIVFSSIEFFKYLNYNLQRHYAAKIQKKLDTQLQIEEENKDIENEVVITEKEEVK